MKEGTKIKTKRKKIQGFKIEMSAKDWIVWADQLINFDDFF